MLTLTNASFVVAQAGSHPVRVVIEQQGNSTALFVSALSVAIALAALVLTLRRELQDRAQLYVTTEPIGTVVTATMTSTDSQIVITVENRGRQPTLVSSIGLEWDIEPPLPGGEAKGDAQVSEPLERARIEPGGHRQVVCDPAILRVHVDTPMRAYAQAGRRRIYEERPQAPLRILTFGGWKPTGAKVADRLVRPTEAPYAKPVVARWKLWRPHALRTRLRAALSDLTPEDVAERLGEIMRDEEAER